MEPLRKINPDYATVQGRDLTIEDRESGKVYMTNVSYMNKLFDQKGYKSLGVIKILEDFAGKYVSDVGTLRNSNLYVDDDKDIFIVASEEAVEGLDYFYKKLEEDKYEIVSHRLYDDYLFWDELVIKSPTGTYYAIYVDLVDEYLQVLALDFKDNMRLYGMTNEGSYKFDEDGLESLFILMSNPVDISPNFTLDEDLSVKEYATLMCNLGYVKYKRKKYNLTDEGESLADERLLYLLDEFNIKSDLQQRITKSGLKFKDACELISISYENSGKFLWDFIDLFNDNAFENSDIFQLEK